MSISKLSASETLNAPYTEFKSMNAGNQYGAMVPIASHTFDGNSGGVSFTGIPQTFRDLMIVTTIRNASGGGTGLNDMGMTFNTLGSVYSWTVLQGDGASTTSSRSTATYYMKAGLRPLSGNTAGIFASNVSHILNYTSTSAFKTMLTRSAADLNGSGQSVLIASLIGTTEAINRVDVTTAGGGNLAAGCTATLYGIRASNA